MTAFEEDGVDVLPRRRELERDERREKDDLRSLSFAWDWPGGCGWLEPPKKLPPPPEGEGPSRVVGREGEDAPLVKKEEVFASVGVRPVAEEDCMASEGGKCGAARASVVVGWWLLGGFGGGWRQKLAASASAPRGNESQSAKRLQSGLLRRRLANPNQSTPNVERGVEACSRLLQMLRQGVCVCGLRGLDEDGTGRRQARRLRRLL